MKTNEKNKFNEWKRSWSVDLINENFFLIVAILILAIALTLSTIDTLINAISSLIIIDGKVVNKYFTGKKIQDKKERTLIKLEKTA